jgi:hypothetical protein
MVIQWRIGLAVLSVLVACRRESGTDGSDSGSTGSASVCPAAWLQAPAVDPSIAVPTAGSRIVLHALANGTQNYTCAKVTVDSGASYVWTFVGPEATLSDCHAVVIGRHFASDAGASAPEWQALDGAYVVAHKVAAFTPQGNAGAVPWLLLGADGRGGSGALSEARYVQRVSTHGGAAPSVPCDASSVGTTQKVAYTADYFFYGT